MNGNNLNMDSNNDFDNINSTNTYHATTNLNTALENPEISIGSITDVNIENVNNVNTIKNEYEKSVDRMLDNNIHNNSLDNSHDLNVNSSFNNDYNSSVNESFLPKGSGSNFISNNVDNMYAPTMEKKDKPHNGLVISKELKTMFFIIIILVIVVMGIPYVYDFLDKLGLIITG